METWDGSGTSQGLREPRLPAPGHWWVEPGQGQDWLCPRVWWQCDTTRKGGHKFPGSSEPQESLNLTVSKVG